MKNSFKSQSAMEYLMTYGWAILIIAVVLGVLVQLGVFSSMSFAPKATPGGCQVFRTQFTPPSLQGTCQGALPQYVALFNGQNGYVDAGNAANLNLGANGGAGTIVVWFKTTKITREAYVFRVNPASPWNGFGFAISQNAGTKKLAFWSSSGSGTWVDANSIIVTNGTWRQGVVTFSGTSSTFYVDGKFDGTKTIAPVGAYSANFLIGLTNGASDYFNGTISNVQVYNVSLSANEIQALYLKGIGGVPIDLQHIAGWWPLNGDANDYSGNKNNGMSSSGVFFTTSWTSN